MLDFEKELDPSLTIRDTSTLGARAARFLRRGDQAGLAIAGFAIAGFFLPQILEISLLGAAITSAMAISAQKKTGLPMQVPLSAKTHDPKEINLSTKKPGPGKGIFYLGNDIKTNEEIWLTDTQARTHMMFLGTTGSGKTEFLLSTVFNSLIHGSGMIYVDGKADNSLYGKIYSMARFMGREDDVLLINFQTGAKDIYASTPKKMSNTVNPFAVGSSGMLSQLVVGLMSGGKEGGKSDVWENRAISFVEGLLKPLVYLRDYYGLLLDVEVIRNYFNLEPLAELLYSNMQKKDNAFGAKEWVERADAKYPGIGQTLSGLAAYIDNLPGWKEGVPVAKQESVVSEQHGYITMQLIRTFNSLADTYGYIMKTPLAEIDFYDVFVNRRILVVLLPALEKSPPELTNLGRIVVASIKATMAVGLGADVEGDWSKVIDSKPTTAPSPYPCTLDEYGYYAVEGFAVVPAQARSLGFSAIFAGQDLPAFEKASKPEAESTLANTTTKFCGKLECTKTYEYFKSTAGEGVYTKAGGFQNKSGMFVSQNYMDTQSAQFERMNRVAMDDLKAQASGEWHMFVGKRIIRINSFFSNPARVKKLRTNHFIPVAPPSNEHCQRVTHATKVMASVVLGEKTGLREPEILQKEDVSGTGFDWLSGVVSNIWGEEQRTVDDSIENSKDLEGIFFDEDVCEIADEEDPLGAILGDNRKIDFSGLDDVDSIDDMIFGEPEPAVSQEDIAKNRHSIDGTLNRDMLVDGMRKIESGIGRSDERAGLAAEVSASVIAEATKYPITAPSAEPDIEDFISIADTVETLFAKMGDQDDDR